MKSGGFQVKSARFRTDFTGEIHWISGEIHQFHTDFTGEIRQISKDQLPGMVSPMF